MKQIYLKNQKGMTLIEIMVAFMLITGTFFAIVQAFPMGLSINKRAESASIASFLAQEKIEEYWSLGYDTIATGTVEIKHPLSTDPNNYLYHFKRKTTIDYLDSSMSTTTNDLGMKRISTTIYYEDALSKKETAYNISTIISQR